MGFRSPDSSLGPSWRSRCESVPHAIFKDDAMSSLFQPNGPEEEVGDEHGTRFPVDVDMPSGSPGFGQDEELVSSLDMDIERDSIRFRGDDIDGMGRAGLGMVQVWKRAWRPVGGGEREGGRGFFGYRHPHGRRRSRPGGEREGGRGPFGLRHHGAQESQHEVGESRASRAPTLPRSSMTTPGTSPVAVRPGPLGLSGMLGPLDTTDTPRFRCYPCLELEARLS